MPIYEYSCVDCGSRFEKLVRRSAEAESLECPSCGQKHLKTEYSTFAAHGGGKAQSESAGGACGSGMCGTNFCGSGMCGMNMN